MKSGRWKDVEEILLCAARENDLHKKSNLILDQSELPCAQSTALKVSRYVDEC